MNDFATAPPASATPTEVVTRNPISELETKIRGARDALERQLAQIRFEASAQSAHVLYDMLEVLGDDFSDSAHTLDLPDAINKSFQNATTALYALASDLDRWALNLTDAAREVGD